jgi:hypothetical protein
VSLKSIAFVLVALAAASPCASQSIGSSLHKDERVAIRVPVAAFGGIEAGYRQWAANVSVSDSTITINDSTDWASLGFAPQYSLRVAELKVDTKKSILRIKLDREHGPDLHLLVPLADTAFVIPRLFAPAADSAVVHAESYAAVSWRVFGDDTVSIPPPVRNRLLEIADSLHQGDTVRVVKLRGKPYLQFRAPESAFVYNENQTSEPQRQSGVLNEVAFPIVRLLAGTDSTLPNSFGFGIIIILKSKDLSGQYSWLNSTSRDQLTLYVLADVASRFAAAEITSQELVDQSVVMVRGNRIKVDLTK